MRVDSTVRFLFIVCLWNDPWRKLVRPTEIEHTILLEHEKLAELLFILQVKHFCFNRLLWGPRSNSCFFLIHIVWISGTTFLLIILKGV